MISYTEALNEVMNHQPVISDCDHAHAGTISNTTASKSFLKENKKVAPQTGCWNIFLKTKRDKTWDDPKSSFFAK